MKYNKKEMKIRFDFNNMMAQNLSNNQGITDTDLHNISSKLKKAHSDFETNRGKNMMGWTELPYNQKEIVDDIIKTSKDIRKKFDTLVVLGIGGSALGPISLFQALNHLHHNDLPKRTRKAPKLYVEDNIDPERMVALLDIIDIEKTIFNVVSKSGTTSETMTQYLIINNILKERLKDRAKDHIIATTSENSGEMIKIAKNEGYKTFYIPDGVGGRFSELSPVGLLTAAVLRVDIKALLKGAEDFDKASKNSNYKKNMALMAAGLYYLSMQKGKNISVVMPYADSLKYISDWYAQLWAESLGKAIDLNGKIVNTGQTPVKALGVTDQHSQVQLYSEGPYDKIISFIDVDRYRETVTIPEGLKDVPNVNFLCSHTMNELIKAEKIATEYALTKANKMNNTITLPEVNPYTIGQLLAFFMYKTAYTGSLLNIDTFNQPGVEEGKNATYALLGRAGYEQKRAELEKGLKKEEKYIL